MTSRGLPSVWTTALSVLLLCGVVGCSDGGTYDLSQPASLDWTIDAHPGWVRADFEVGSQPRERRVLLFNGGGGDLRVTGVDFTSEISELRIVWHSGEPTWPAVLSGAERLRLAVRYAPDPNQPRTGAATLVIHHDAGPDVSLRFEVVAAGPTPTLDAASLHFINASAANPPTQCVRVKNGGGGSLSLLSAAFETPSKHYAITQAPLGPVPQAGAQVCVRFTPGAPCEGAACAAYDARLVLTTDAKAQPARKVALSASWQRAALHVRCGAGGGPLRLDLRSATSTCCEVRNEGPGPAKLNAVDVLAFDSAQQVAAEDGLSWQLLDGGEPADLERGLGAGKQLDLCVSRAPGADPVGADVLLRYAVGGQPAALALPVVSGDCTAGALVSAPGGAALGLDDTATWTFANQGCGTVTLLSACVVQAQAPGQAPCSGPPAPGYSAALGLTALPAWGLHGLTLTRQPGAATQAIAQVVYCPAALVDGACPETARDLSLPLLAGPASGAPTLTLQLANSPEAGGAVEVEALTTPGALPLASHGAWRWAVTARPLGSTTWLGDALQSTDTPRLVLQVDKPGAYTLSGRVMALTPNQTPAWSPEAALTFVVP